MLSPSHNLSTLDQQALTLIITFHLLQSVQSKTMNYSHAGQKHSAPDPAPSSPQKQPCLCFWCGFPGHLPDTYKAKSTAAGHPAAPLATRMKSKNTLIGPNNKFFCFDWARDSSCSFGNGCNNLHACSLCGDTSHSA